MTDDPRPILGFDINKQAIRVGDRVKAVGQQVREPYRGRAFTAIGMDEYAARANQLLPTLGPFITLSNGKFVRCACLARLEPDGRLVSNWATIRAISGWIPKEVRNDSRPQD